jgi:hypothetical protein
MRGNALLALAGIKVSGTTPVDDFDVFLGQYRSVIYTFRGGKWKPWWDEDLRMLGALGVLYLNEALEGVIVLHELDNDITEVYIPAPSKDEASLLVERAVIGWREFARIPKNSPRALVLCQYCPIKRQCDALDLEKGDTSDWPAGYTPG